MSNASENGARSDGARSPVIPPEDDLHRKIAELERMLDDERRVRVSSEEALTLLQENTKFLHNSIRQLSRDVDAMREENKVLRERHEAALRVIPPESARFAHGPPLPPSRAAAAEAANHDDTVREVRAFPTDPPLVRRRLAEEEYERASLRDEGESQNSAARSREFREFRKCAAKFAFSNEDGDDVREWIKTIEEQRTIYDLTHAELVPLMPTLLKGNAKERWRSFKDVMDSAGQPVSFEMVTQWLQRTFLTTAMVASKINAYEACRQKGRAIDVYYHEIVKLRKHLSQPGDQMQQVAHFVRGLDDDLKQRVGDAIAGRHDLTFEGVVDIARAMTRQRRDTQGRTGTHRIVADEEVAPDNVAINAVDLQQIVCYNCNERGHFSRNCPKPQKERGPHRRNQRRHHDRNSDRNKDKDSEKAADIRRVESEDKSKDKEKAKPKDADKGKDKPKDKGSEVFVIQTAPLTDDAFPQSYVAQVECRKSRAVPLMQTAATIENKYVVCMGWDSYAGVSCVGQADIPAPLRSRVVPSVERLQHAGGAAIRSPLEITLKVLLGTRHYDVTFNVLESESASSVGWLLGSDFMEMYDVSLRLGRRQVEIPWGDPLPLEERLETRATKEALMVSQGVMKIAPTTVAAVPEATATPTTICRIAAAQYTCIPPRTKVQIEGVFDVDDPSQFFDAATGTYGEWVYTTPEADEVDKRRSPLAQMWDGLSRTRHVEGTNKLALPVNVVNSSNRPIVIKRNAPLGTVVNGVKTVGRDTYILGDQYIDWLERELGFCKKELLEAFSLDADYKLQTWTDLALWLNAPWELMDFAVAKLLAERPKYFVLLGMDSNKKWLQTLRDMGCREVKVPKAFGKGYFSQLMSDGSFKELKFPWWSLTAFVGTAELIDAYKERTKNNDTKVYTAAAAAAAADVNVAAAAAAADVNVAAAAAAAADSNVTTAAAAAADFNVAAAAAAAATDGAIHAAATPTPGVPRAPRPAEPPPVSDEYLDVIYSEELTPSQRAQIQEVVYRHRAAFDTTKLAARIPDVECTIDTGDHAPLACQPFQVSPARRAKIDEKLDKMLAMDVIEASSSPWASRFFLVPQVGRLPAPAYRRHARHAAWSEVRVHVRRQQGVLADTHEGLG